MCVTCFSAKLANFPLEEEKQRLSPPPLPLKTCSNYSPVLPRRNKKKGKRERGGGEQVEMPFWDVCKDASLAPPLEQGVLSQTVMLPEGKRGSPVAKTFFLFLGEERRRRNRRSRRRRRRRKKKRRRRSRRRDPRKKVKSFFKTRSA